jgi:hypothetical protein
MVEEKGVARIFALEFFMALLLGQSKNYHVENLETFLVIMNFDGY